MTNEKTKKDLILERIISEEDSHGIGCDNYRGSPSFSDNYLGFRLFEFVNKAREAKKVAEDLGIQLYVTSSAYLFDESGPAIGSPTKRVQIVNFEILTEDPTIIDPKDTKVLRYNCKIQDSIYNVLNLVLGGIEPYFDMRQRKLRGYCPLNDSRSITPLEDRCFRL